MRRTNCFLIGAVCLMFPLLLLGSPSGVKPATTTVPSPPPTTASISLAGVELKYTGPLRVKLGDAQIRIALINHTDMDVICIPRRIDQKLTFNVEINSPNREKWDFDTDGVVLPLAAPEGSIEVGAGKCVEEVVTIPKNRLNVKGEYHITISRSYNGSIHFPERLLQVSRIPLFVGNDDQ